MEYVETILSFLNSAEVNEWFVAISGVVTAATAVTALTPSTADNAALNFILKVLNFVAGNFLKNKNADAD